MGSPIPTLLNRLLLIAALVGLVSSLLSGESRARVALSSTPSGALVVVDGDPRGFTPLVVELCPRRSHSIRLEHEGYQAYDAMAQPILRWSLVFNWIGPGFFWGAVQTGVDLCTANAFVLSPSKLDVRLRPATPLRLASRGRMTEPDPS
jgi:hypothetical protein